MTTHIARIGFALAAWMGLASAGAIVRDEAPERSAAVAPVVVPAPAPLAVTLPLAAPPEARRVGVPRVSRADAVLAARVCANENTRAVCDLALFLAQTCVAEVSFRSTGECVVMWDVQARKAQARGVALDAQISGYHSIWKQRRDGSWLVQSARTRWIRSLVQSTEEPPGWRAAESTLWDGDRWLAVYAAAVAFTYGEALSPCPDADEYGGDCDDDRAACDPPRACWTRVDCGDTAQAYWSTRPCREPRAVIPAALAAGRADGVW